jgi:uncharacterized protein
MIDDVFVIDAVAHAFDFSAEAPICPEGVRLREIHYDMHVKLNRPQEVLPHDVFLREHTAETLARTLFLETATDFAVTHHVPMYSWFRDGIVNRRQHHECIRRWPNRFLGYAGVDPTQGIDVALRQLDEQLAACPTLVGVKLYPVAVNPLRSYRLDDKDMFPLYDKILEYGLQVVAVHKVLPLGPVPLKYLEVDDVDNAAYAYPSLKFELVHAGLAWVDETAIALAALPNVYVNFEYTTGWLTTGPAGRFMEALATFLKWAGHRKIFYSSGALLNHPWFVLDRFWAMQFSQELCDKYRIEPLTKEQKADMLGRNYANMLGLDIAEMKKRIENDEFSQERRANGKLLPAWSALRAQAERESNLVVA